jgi:preprotein translocase subunit SecG
MSAVLLVIHIMLAIAMVATVLLQRSEGGALGIGGGGMGGFMTGRATANLLSRTTAVLATCFMLTSLLLAYLGGIDRKPASILESPVATQPAQPAAVPAEKPAEPDVPIAK